MQSLSAVPITRETFAPFGTLLEAPAEFGRTYFDEGLHNGRAAAPCSLSIAHVAAVSSNGLIATQMERHVFSSQSFIPMSPARYLVMVAPKDATGGPDVGAARAFIVSGGQGITYAADTWHHPLTVFDAPARFAVLMWRDGSGDDEEFVTLAEPIALSIPAA